MTHPILPQQRTLVTSPRGGAPGSEVTVGMSGMPRSAGLRISFGSMSAYEVIDRVETDSEGNFTVTVRVPLWAEREEVHFFFVRYGAERTRVLSEGFHVTAPDGTAQVVGDLGSEGGSCVELRNSAEVRYNLVGEIGQWPAGTRVSVSGTIADGASCGDQGVTIAVKEIKAL